jgi:hypothetical protein
MTVEILQPGPTAWEHTCSRCSTVFRYSVSDLRVERLFGLLRLGWLVPCPSCSFSCSIPDGRSEEGWSSALMPARKAVRTAQLPSYAELVEALRWLAPTVDNSLSMAADAGVDEEEIDEVRVSLNDYRPMLRRIGIELPDDPEWAKATSEIEHDGLKKEIERLREEER